jgi:hypothetical protein
MRRGETVKGRKEIEKMKKELQDALMFGSFGANERIEIFASGMIFALEWVLGELEEAKG